MKTNVLGWGLGGYGRLAQGDVITRPYPVVMKGLEQETTIDAVQLGAAHVVILANGTVYTHGKCHFGQLGHGELDKDEFLPKPVQGLSKERVRLIGAGESHCFAVTEGDELYGWGCAFFGALGTGNEQHALTPTKITCIDRVKDIVAIVGGGSHSLFLLNDGSVLACGGNQWGQCGVGGTSRQVRNAEKVAFPEDVKIVAIAASRRNSIFLDSNGRVYTCGTNEFGQLGIGDASKKMAREPVLIGGLLETEKIVAIAAAKLHCVVASSDRIFTWGSGRYGCLGNGTTEQTFLPTQVKFPSQTNPYGFVEVSAGSSHTIARTAEGQVWSWGSGEYG
eukprot:Colp12_sorted_trinity150504_noHs@20584